jgi:hypothetical protein
MNSGMLTVGDAGTQPTINGMAGGITGQDGLERRDRHANGSAGDVDGGRC